jgi:YVTN family beta-propeller protein
VPIGGFSSGPSGSIAITPDGTTAYVVNEDIDTVTPIDTSTNTVGSSIPVGYQPTAVAVTPGGSTAYVATSFHIVTPQDYTLSSLTPIDTATDTTGTPIPTNDGFYPQNNIAITPDGATAYVTASGVITVNTTTGTVGSVATGGSDTSGIAITPDQAPVAKLSVTPAVAGQPTGFDASASTVAVGTITSYAWNFGDGSTATTSTPTTTHTYATAGPSTATVTETDSAGTSTTQVFTGQTMSNNGGPSAVASENFTVPAAFSTSVLVPSNGAALSGSTYLDAAAFGATSVESAWRTTTARRPRASSSLRTARRCRDRPGSMPPPRTPPASSSGSSEAPTALPPR